MENDKLTFQLVSVSGFIARYMQHLSSDITQQQAYEFTEQEYELYFGRRRYSCYDSFRQVKNRKLKAN